MESRLETVIGPVYPEGAGYGLSSGHLSGYKFVANGVIPAQEQDQVVLAFVGDGNADILAVIVIDRSVKIVIGRGAIFCLWQDTEAFRLNGLHFGEGPRLAAWAGQGERTAIVLRSCGRCGAVCHAPISAQGNRASRSIPGDGRVQQLGDVGQRQIGGAAASGVRVGDAGGDGLAVTGCQAIALGKDCPTIHGQLYLREVDGP